VSLKCRLVMDGPVVVVQAEGRVGSPIVEMYQMWKAETLFREGAQKMNINGMK